MAEPVTLHVAETKVFEDVRIDHKPIGDLHISAGTELNLRMSYRVYEEHPAEDLWTFRLTAQVEGEEESVSERRHHDRRFVSDDVLSHVGIDLRFPVAGTFKLTYTASGTLGRREWDSLVPFEQMASNEVTETVTITVD